MKSLFMLVFLTAMIFIAIGCSEQSQQQLQSGDSMGILPNEPPPPPAQQLLLRLNNPDYVVGTGNGTGYVEGQILSINVDPVSDEGMIKAVSLGGNIHYFPITGFWICREDSDPPKAIIKWSGGGLRYGCVLLTNEINNFVEEYYNIRARTQNKPRNTGTSAPSPREPRVIELTTDLSVVSLGKEIPTSVGIDSLRTLVESQLPGWRLANSSQGTTLAQALDKLFRANKKGWPLIRPPRATRIVCGIDDSATIFFDLPESASQRIGSEYRLPENWAINTYFLLLAK